MSSTYNVLAGDTFELISRKSYGSELEAQRIAMANPGAVEPLSPGTTLTIPDQPNAPQNVPQAAPSGGVNEVSIAIDGERFRFWESIRIRQSIDAISTAGFSAPFEPNAPGFKETFVPLSYKRFEVNVGGAPLFTGTILPVDPGLTPERKSLAISGYSLPGVLQDCMFPASAFPLEFNNQNLKDIAEKAAGFFGLSVEFEGTPGPVFERTGADPAKKVLAFITELAKQRNRITTDTPRGALLFPEIVETGNPVANLREGESPLQGVTPSISPQSYYSHVTGIAPAVVGKAGKQFTVKNPFMSGVIRPFVFKADDTTPADLQAAVEAKAGRMFGNVVSYACPVATWRDPSGALWKPNTTITLFAPGAMVYNVTELVIRAVDFEKTGDTERVVLTVVLPGSFNGKIPEALPWLD